MSNLFTLENFSRNIRILITRVGLPLGREIENKLRNLNKMEIVSCQNPSPGLINEEPFDVVIHLAGFDPPSFAETLYHTSILHQLLDLCLKHKAKFILVLPLGKTSLKEVAVSLVSQFHKLFSVNFELIEIGEKDLLSDSADEVINRFVHRTHLQKLKKAFTEKVKEEIKPKTVKPNKIIFGLLLMSIIPLGIIMRGVVGEKLIQCSQKSLQTGLWTQSRKCANGAVALGISPKLAKLFLDLAKVGELGGQLLSGRSEDLENFSGELSYARERIAQVQIEILDEPTRILLGGWRELLSRLKYVTADAGVLLGTNKSINYLILIQDVNEVRSTGGFIEGVGLLTVAGGKTENIQLLTSYTADGLLKGSVTPPNDLMMATGEQGWYLRDSNWDPSFPNSAKQAAWFVEKQLQKITDIVVGLNTKTLAKILTVTGPITLPGEPHEINSGNLMSIGLAKATADPANRSFYLDVFGAILTKLQVLPSGKLGQLGAVFLDGLESRQIMISPVGETVLPNIIATGWDGNLGSFADSIYMVSSNVGINKANSSVDQKTTIDVSLTNLEAQVSISSQFVNKSTSNTWPAGNYKNYLRFYLPNNANLKHVLVNDKKLGAELINIKSTPEFMEVGFLINVLPNQSTTVGVSFNRNLPKTNRFSYALNILNQPGVEGASLGVSIHYPATWLAQINKSAGIAAAGLLKYNTDTNRPFKTSVDFLKRD